MSFIDTCWLRYVCSVKSFFCIDANANIKGAVRLEHQFYALGQTCAHSCDLLLRNPQDIQDIPYAELKQRLEADGLTLDASHIAMPDIP